MVNTCGSGLAPPKGMVKSRGFTWLKTLGPTDTLTGTVTLQPVVLNKIWPTQVPAVARNWRAELPPAADPPPSLAVLPFTDMSQEGDLGYFCDGIAEEIVSALSRIQGLS